MAHLGLTSSGDLSEGDLTSSWMEETDPPEEDLRNSQDKQLEQFYRTMKPLEFEKRQQDLTKNISELCAFPPPFAELLLCFYKWDVEKIQNEYFEDPESYCKRAGVLYDSEVSPIPSGNKPVECCICCEDVRTPETYRLGCGHGIYCKNCWKSHIREKIRDGVYFVKCIQPRCWVLLTEDAYNALADTEDHFRFRRAVRRSLVNLNPKMRCCPNPRTCNNIIEYLGPGTSKDTVTCGGCNFVFCFACEREDHRPVTCSQMESWEEKARDPASKESMNWITANTKPCPECKKNIFKDEGCNHMTCRPPSGCGFEFCWLCRGAWKDHGQHTGGFYSCNKYEQSCAKKVDDDAARVRQEVERYLHYYNRYHNYHSDVVNSSEKKLREAREKVNLFRSDSSSKRHGVNPEFIIKAVEIEIECRKVLKYTYILAYFLNSDPKRSFFEFCQANVEGITERLADLNRTPINTLNDDELKNRVKVTEQYLHSMVKVMEEISTNQLNEDNLKKGF